MFEAIPEDIVDRTPTNSRYDDQIKIFGREVQEKLLKIKPFVVGAGSLGCETIKAFALMGVGCAPEGKIHCTDGSVEQKKDLNRSFLCRPNNCGDSKSHTICEAAKMINSNLNSQAYSTNITS